jgi:hypothetical protein
MTPMFQTAQRRKAKLRLGIDGPSGSGKTYSALLIARGLASDWERVALIDTERGSGSLYADLGPYAVLPLAPPFSPQRYIKAIAAAAAEGFEVVIIDSLSHAWSGEGGLLDQVDKIAKSSTSGNSFQAWKEGTPIQNQLIDAMLSSPLHVIATMRSKTEWVVEKNEKGKSVPRKVGLAPEQRKDLEYEFTVMLDLSREHIATAGKDRTGIFDSFVDVPTTETGQQLLAWLESGAEAPAPAAPLQAAPTPAQTQSREQPTPLAIHSPATITEAEQQALLALVAAKGYEVANVERSLRNAGICSDGIASIPSERLRHVMTIIAGLKEKLPVGSDPVATEANDEAAAEAEGEPDGDGFESIPAEEWSEEPLPAREPLSAPLRKPADQGQITMLDEQAAKLRRLGVPAGKVQEELARYGGGKQLHAELTHDEALAVIDHRTHWLAQLASKKQRGAA